MRNHGNMRSRRGCTRDRTHTWTACAVKDEIDFGLKPGGQLEIESTLCIESKRALAPIVIDHASLDPFAIATTIAPRAYKIESYVSVPILLLLPVRYFTGICALLTPLQQRRCRDPKVIAMFTRFAALIAMQLG